MLNPNLKSDIHKNIENKFRKTKNGRTKFDRVSTLLPIQPFFISIICISFAIRTIQFLHGQRGRGREKKTQMCVFFFIH
jgi:hypothetical protein